MTGDSRGFTLIELLAATLLSAALTAGVLAVVVRMNRTKNLLLRAPEASIEVRAAFEAIRSDVEQARSVEREDRKLTLTGLNAAHRPALVIYRREGDALIREERELDRRDGEGLRRELVLAGVEAFQIEEVRNKLHLSIQLRGRKHEGWVVP